MKFGYFLGNSKEEKILPWHKATVLILNQYFCKIKLKIFTYPHIYT